MHEVTRTLTRHYESCLARHGANARGMDWGDNTARLQLRFDAISRAIGLREHDEPMSVLDAGCGCGLLLEHFRTRWPGRVAYAGMDASASMIDAARARHPHAAWTIGDIIDADGLTRADWVVANGLLTEKREVTHERMVQYAKAVLVAMFNLCERGMTFNVLTTHVNYRDERLFYWEPGEALAFCVRHLSRHVTIHHDLEMYEYFCTVRREPWRNGIAHA